MWIVSLSILAAIALWVWGYAIGRKNPNIKIVNTLLTDGKLAIDEAGKLIKKL